MQTMIDSVTGETVVISEMGPLFQAAMAQCVIVDTSLRDAAEKHARMAVLYDLIVNHSESDATVGYMAEYDAIQASF
jgi:hypothetical protein